MARVVRQINKPPSYPPPQPPYPMTGGNRRSLAYQTTVPVKTDIGKTYEKEMRIDPFTQAGLIDLGNVKPIALDSGLTIGQAPYPLDPLQYNIAKTNYGYMYPGEKELYVNPQYPTKDVAATITHEGIHSLMDPKIFSDNPRWDEWTTLPNEVGKDIYSALGPVRSDEQMKEPWLDNYYIGGGPDRKYITKYGDQYLADDIRNELITRWFEDQVWGGTAPSAKFKYPKYSGYVNYATMMRPGQGPLGMEGLLKILAKKGKPMLKKVALQAHKNIEKKYEKEQKAKKIQQQKTIAANRKAAKKFGDKPQPIFYQDTKSEDRGGRDIGSRVSESYEKQDSAQYGMLAKGGLVNHFKYGGYLG
jgi:hypothetical protein